MSTGNRLERTPANFRAEMARYQITRKDLAAFIVMNPTQLSNYLNETIESRVWAMHNIAWGLNHLTGVKLFPAYKTLMSPPQGRPSGLLDLPLRPLDDGLPRMRVPGGL